MMSISLASKPAAVVEALVLPINLPLSKISPQIVTNQSSIEVVPRWCEPNAKGNEIRTVQRGGL